MSNAKDHRMKTFFLTIILILGSLLPVAAQVFSDFEGGTTDGWYVEGDNNYYWEATYGNPGGCLRVDDDATGNMNRAFAPLKFLGNWSAATSSDTLRADIFLHPVATAYVSGNFVFRISGPGGQATAIYSPTPAPPFDTWHTYKVSLAQTDWQLNSGTWSGLLQNVTTLIVTAEYISGDEFDRLDNIQLSFTPLLQPVTPVVCSGFEEVGFDGWYFEGTGAVSNQSTGGNPGRYINIANGAATGYAFAPTKFLGVWTGLDNHAAEIVFDLKITTSGALLLNDALLQISGPGGVARLAMTSGLQDAFGQWHTFAFPVESSAWTMVSGTWGQLLEQVSELRLCVEFSSSTETVGLDDFCISNLPPVAGFTSDVTHTFAGNPVQFTDQSDKAPTSWAWDFGDGSTSTLRDPVHTYTQPGTYDVSLSVSNFFGNDSEVKTGYITVASVEECDLFSDAFPTATINPLWQFTNGTWSISSGVLRQTSNYYGTTYLDGCYAITGSPLWTDYFITAGIQSTDNDQIGLVFNVQDNQNMYMLLWTLESPGRYLYKWENGTGTVLASDAVGYAENTWYTVTAGSFNGNLRVMINGNTVFNVMDETFPSGKAGLYCRGNQNTLYDNVIIRCAVDDTVNTGNVTLGDGVTDCYDATAVLTTGGAGTSFLVQPGGSATLVAGQKVVMLPTTKAEQGGYLHAYVSTDGFYCLAPPLSKPVIAGNPASGSALSGDRADPGSLIIFPNPSQGSIALIIPETAKDRPAQLDVFDFTGRMIRQGLQVAKTAPVIDLGGEPSGIYLVRLTSEGKTWTSRVILKP